MEYSIEERHLIPRNPGVYLFYNITNTLLYIGKAKDLRKRISSYFNKKKFESNKAKKLISYIASIEVIETKGEGDALGLEITLINKYKPKYNVLFKDDKSYPYIALSDEEYPKISITRNQSRQKQYKLFGPFYRSGLAKDKLKEVQDYFQLRTCSKSVFSNRTKPCILHQINQCLAPCVGLVTKSEYKDQVDSATRYLQNGSQLSEKKLKGELKECTKTRQFEKAIIIREKLKNITNNATMVGTTKEDKDVIYIEISGENICYSHVAKRNGVITAQQHWVKKINPFYELDDFIKEGCVDCLRISKSPPAKSLETNYKFNAVARFNKSISKLFSRTIKTMTIDSSSEIVDSAFGLARKIAQDAMNSNNDSIEFLDCLSKWLRLPNHNLIVDVVDNSHWQGRGAVSAYICYDKNGFNYSNYRIYNSNERGDDDLYSMKTSIEKHLRNIKKHNRVKPDVLLIDGGYPQLRACQNSITKYKSTIYPIAISKGKSRIPGIFNVHYRNQYNQLTTVFSKDLPSSLPVFLQKLLDEAHRFSNSRSNKRRSKNIDPSLLYNDG